MNDDELQEAIHLAESLKECLRGSHRDEQISQAQRQNNRTLAHLETEQRIREEAA